MQQQPGRGRRVEPREGEIAVTNDILRPGGPPAKSVGRTEGKAVFLGTVGVRHILDKVQADGRFSALEHPMSPRALAAPLHRHHNEDEYSWIIEGRVGPLLGDEVLYGGPGDFIIKPRGQWHTFWNAGDEPARILEIISPAGFEQFFDELADFGGVDKISTEALDELCARYELEMDVDSIPELSKRFDLKFPGEPVR
jgi:mannose-6-phosphate isomerase-like protein (cupin superfamily)